MLKLSSISHRYDAVQVLQGVDLTVDAGEIVCLLGASGSGKSTLLRVVAGLEALQQGEIRLGGELFAQPGNEPPVEARGFGFVFQDHVLFPHLSVLDNVSFGLTEVESPTRRELALAQLARVGLADFADRFPHTLSGGQQQRVALARALAPEPRVMLLDEPFASVDAALRRRLREDARLILKDSGAPTVLVTHDAEEAMEIADRIAVVHAGAIVQCGTPEEVWASPANSFVAELLSDADVLTGEVTAEGVNTAFGHIHSSAAGFAVGQQCEVVARSTAIEVVADAEGATTVRDIRFLGERYLIVLAAGDGRLRLYTADAPSMDVGERVSVRFDSDGIILYNRE